MNRPEAYSILSTALERYRSSGLAALRHQIGIAATEDIVAPSGIRYTVEITLEWSNPERRALVIRGRIDDQNTFRFSSLEEKIQISNPEHVQASPKVA